MNARFLIENGQVIGLWILLSIIGLFIFNAIFEIADRRASKKRMQKLKETKIRQALYIDAMKWRQQQEEQRQKEFRKTFKKQYLNYIANF